MFVPLAEEGWQNESVTELVAEKYLSEIKKIGVDTVVLGCTHYPLLRNVIQKIFGHSVNLIDSGEAICGLLKNDFIHQKLFKNSKNDVIRFRSIWISDLHLGTTGCQAARLLEAHRPAKLAP